MTQKQFEVICKNMIAAGMYLVFIDNNIGGGYLIQNVVANKTVVNPVNAKVFAEMSEYIAGSVQYGDSYLFDATTLQHQDMINSEYAGEMCDSLIISVDLDQRYSLGYMVVEGEMVPIDNGQWCIIDHQLKVIHTDYINYENDNDYSMNTVTWASIYSAVNKFFESKDLIQVVNTYIPNYIL